jgi:hypothetical protein
MHLRILTAHVVCAAWLLSGCSLTGVEREAEWTELRIGYGPQGIDLSGNGQNDVALKVEFIRAGTRGGVQNVFLTVVRARFDREGAVVHWDLNQLIPKGFVIGPDIPPMIKAGLDEEWTLHPSVHLGSRGSSGDESQTWQYLVPEGQPFLIGVALPSDEDTYYGWLKVSLERNEDPREFSLWVHDYAIAPEPGMSIRAGEHP